MVPDFDRMARGFEVIFVVVCVLVTLLIRFIVLHSRKLPGEGKVVVAPEFGCGPTALTFICVVAVGFGLVYAACR